MGTLTPNLLFYGGEEATPEPIALSAGPLTMRMDRNTGFLRHIRIGDHEVLRGIYVAVRDRNWSTLPVSISSFHIEEPEKETFRILFDAVSQRHEIEVSWRGTIEGDANGRVVFDFEGEAGSSFHYNRIGLCVLHPMAECEGKAMQVEDVDGRCEETAFPKAILPHQVVKAVRSLTHEAAPGVKATVSFEGESFEMEDQRNWTDASFKTYSGTVDAAMPHWAEKGARFSQRVTLTLPESPRRILPVVLGRPPQLTVSTTPVYSKPRIGLGAARHGLPLTDREIERLKAIRPAHLRINVELSDPGYSDRLRQVDEEARRIGSLLHIGVFLSENADAELDGLAATAESLSSPIDLWLIFHRDERVTSDHWAAVAREKLSRLGGHPVIAAGTASDFVELNRHRPSAQYGALPCYSVTPQIHAFDPTTMVENLATQPVTVESVQQFCPQSVVLSPITLRPHYWSSLTQLSGENDPQGGLPPDADPRQVTLFAAGWMIGSLTHLTTTGKVHSLTYFETTGCRGLMPAGRSPDDAESPGWPPEAVFPVYHVLAAIAGYNRVYPTRSSHPLQVEGITLLDDKGHRRILVANLEDREQELKIKTGTCRARIRHLDDTTAEAALFEPDAFRSTQGESLQSSAGKVPLKLRPYAIAFVDLER